MKKEGADLIRPFVFAIWASAALLIFGLGRVAHAAISIEAVETGSPGSDDEFIRFFNSDSNPVDISKYSLQVKNDSSATIQKKNFSPGTVILPKSIYIVANKSGAFALQAQMTYSSIYLSDSGGVVALVASTTLINSFDSPEVVAQSHFAKSITEKTTSTAGAGAGPPLSETTPTKSISATPEFFGIVANRRQEIPIKISELFPRPIQGEEFIELYNSSADGFDVAGLWLRDAARNAYALGSRGEETIIAPYSYRAWPRSITTIALNDTDGELIQLLDNFGIISQANYTEDAPRDASYILMRNAWQWTTTPTPNLPNKFNPLALPPIARAEIPSGPFNIGEIINFSAADTTDPNNDLLNLIWNFGDGTEAVATTTQHVYTAAGNYLITLHANDAAGASSTVSRQITIKEPAPIINPVSNTQTTITAPTTTKVISTLIDSKPTNAKSNKKTSIKKSAVNYFTGTVSMPPGILSTRKFIADGIMIETTTNRPELLNIVAGTQIKYSAQAMVNNNILVHKISTRNKIQLLGALPPPEPTTITGTVGMSNSSNTLVKINDSEFVNLLNASQYKKLLLTGAKITATGFELKPARPDNQTTKNLVLVGSRAIITENSSTNSARTGSTAFLLLIASAGVYALLHLFITRYGKNFYHPPHSRNWSQIIKEKIRSWSKNAQTRFNNFTSRTISWRARLFRPNTDAHREN